LSRPLAHIGARRLKNATNLRRSVRTRGKLVALFDEGFFLQLIGSLASKGHHQATKKRLTRLTISERLRNESGVLKNQELLLRATFYLFRLIGTTAL
jgi:hypothetical protein